MTYTIKKQNRYSGKGGFVSSWEVYVIVGPDGIVLNKNGTREREFKTRQGAERAARKIWTVGKIK